MDLMICYGHQFSLCEPQSYSVQHEGQKVKEKEEEEVSRGGKWDKSNKEARAEGRISVSATSLQFWAVKQQESAVILCP